MRGRTNTPRPTPAKGTPVSAEWFNPDVDTEQVDRVMESETDGSDEPAEEQRLAAEAYHLNSCED